MCGILGTINKPFDNEILSLLKHRGPDDSGRDIFHLGKHEVTFAQRRLSIIDLSPAGHQPMLSPCAKYAIIFNGEIYNHEDLRSELPQTEFRGHSDTETILHYLIHFGIEAVNKLNGIFALAFLDIEKHRVHLARDPIGVKPLYFALNGNELIFSSEIRPINALINEHDLDFNALASLLRLRYNPSPDTLYKAIRKIGPGILHTFNLADSDITHTSRIFSNSSKKSAEGTDKELTEIYGKNFEDAVKRQLLSDVEVGVLLSGGIDSAMVASVAQKFSSKKLKAFTIGFHGEFNEDETEDAKETARLLQLDHHVERIDFNDFLLLIKECVRIVEEPLATTSIIPMYFLAKMASTKVKVVLTGQGADEPLGGYARYKGELFRKKIPAPLRPLVKPVVKAFRIKNEQILRGANVVNIRNEPKRFLAAYQIFSDEEIQHLIGRSDTISEERITTMYHQLEYKDGVTTVEKMMAIDTRMNLSDDLLNYTDKITMHFSMECRVPILDLKLLKFIESLPLELKMNRSEGKIIHKQFAKQLLPEQIINRPKKGFQSPTRRWFMEEAEQLKNILLNPSTNFADTFNLEFVEKLLEQHCNGYNKEKQIFLLLSIYFWMELNDTNISNHAK